MILNEILNLLCSGEQYSTVEPLVRTYLSTHKTTYVAESILRVNNEIIQSQLLTSEINSVLFCFAIEHITESLFFDILEHRVSYVNFHNNQDPQKWLDIILANPYHRLALGNDIADVYRKENPEISKKLTEIIIHYSDRRII